jgi:beta-galactosidase
MWYEPDFDDSKWQTGKSGFGTPSGDGARVGTEWKASDIWIRKSFELTEIPKEPVFRVFHDEDFEIYVNGILACQGTGFTVEYLDFKVPEKVLTSLKKGKNDIAVHCRQTTGGQFIDVGIYGK